MEDINIVRDGEDAIAFLKEYEQCLSNTWSLSPEGRRHACKFRSAISILEASTPKNVRDSDVL